MSGQIQIQEATPADTPAIHALWTAYRDSLAGSPGYDGFAQDLADIPGKYARPQGRLILATLDGLLVGTVALRPLNAEDCEAKRLYLTDAARGRGLGRALMQRIIDEARAAGYKRILGDTQPDMTLALALYERMGFRRTSAYPGAQEGMIYIEYDLTADPNP